MSVKLMSSLIPFMSDELSDSQLLSYLVNERALNFIERAFNMRSFSTGIYSSLENVTLLFIKRSVSNDKQQFPTVPALVSYFIYI